MSVVTQQSNQLNQTQSPKRRTIQDLTQQQQKRKRGPQHISMHYYRTTTTGLPEIPEKGIHGTDKGATTHNPSFEDNNALLSIAHPLLNFHKLYY